MTTLQLRFRKAMKRLNNRSDFHDWQGRADEALEVARAMPSGPERIDAFKKAGILRTAADAKAVFSPSMFTKTDSKSQNNIIAGSHHEGEACEMDRDHERLCNRDGP
jgi:hypothetical protein